VPEPVLEEAAARVGVVAGPGLRLGGWGVCDGRWLFAAGAVATGANLAVSTNGVFAGGAGASRWENPSSTSACSVIEASTHQSKGRAPAAAFG